MRRTTIVALEHLLQNLRRVAAERATSVAGLIVYVLQHRIGSRPPRARSVVAGASGHVDASERMSAGRPIPR